MWWSRSSATRRSSTRACACSASEGATWRWACSSRACPSTSTSAAWSARTSASSAWLPTTPRAWRAPSTSSPATPAGCRWPRSWSTSRSTPSTRPSPSRTPARCAAPRSSWTADQEQINGHGPARAARIVPVATLPSEIRTQRLVPRVWRADHAEALGRAIPASLDHLRPWMPWAADEPLALEARVALIAQWQRDHAADGDAVYGILGDGTVVGGTGLNRRRGPGVLEIGYWIGVDHIGRGYATEAAR